MFASCGLLIISEEWRGALDSNEVATKDALSIYHSGMEKRMNAAEQWRTNVIDGIFVWGIDRVSERRANREFVESEYFYAKMRPYKMTLAMNANGVGSVAGNDFVMWLYIYSDVRDGDLKWPLQADITITIMNKADPEARKAITKPCVINKPPNNSYKSSAAFKFFYSDLSNDSLLVVNGLMVECRVDLR